MTDQDTTTAEFSRPPRFLDIHVLHSVPFSNLNRDDLGQPKEAHYGGVRRIRVSSQCIKRTVRKRMEADQVCEAAIRTKRLTAEIAEVLEAREGWTSDTASIAAVALLDVAGFSPAKGDEHRTDMITFLPESAADTLAGIADRHAAMIQALVDAVGIDTSEEASRLKTADLIGNALKNPKDKEKARKRINGEPGWAEASKALVEEVKEALKATNPMIALMGRMYASLPEGNVDGAVQAAHAITTHAAATDGDYFTTVDDLNPADETGAGFLDVADYASGVFYKYATIDLDALAENMGGTASERAELAAAFADRFARSMSDAKKRVTAPHTPPSLVLVSARTDAPLSYANAFERPVITDGGGYVAPSVARFLEEDAEAAGHGGSTRSWLYISRTAADSEPETGHTRVALSELAPAIAAHLAESISL